MRTKRRTGFTLAVIGCLGVALAFGLSGTLFAAQETASSSECIKCHTDLKKMDRYGAASAGGGAAIAG